jgi:hypothetical protein
LDQKTVAGQHAAIWRIITSFMIDHGKRA